MLNRDKGILEDKIRRLEDDIKVKKGLLETADERKNKEVQEKDMIIEELNTFVDELQEKLSKQDMDIMDFKTRIDEKENENVEKAYEIEYYAERVKDLTDENEKLTLEVDEFRSKESNGREQGPGLLQKKVQALESQLQSQKFDMDKLRQSVLLHLFIS